jgi:hypothetical protein
MEAGIEEGEAQQQHVRAMAKEFVVKQCCGTESFLCGSGRTGADSCYIESKII